LNDRQQRILERVFEEFLDRYQWKIEDSIIRHATMLFPFLEPEQKVRDAIKVLMCKREKTERETIWLRSLQKDQEIYEKTKEHDVYKKILPQQNNEMPNKIVNDSVNINRLMKMIYGECKTCPSKEPCKVSFAILNEYVTSSLIKLDFELTPKNK
jgi:hypothetical protein